ncbi:MAG: hypothetical protein Fur0015_01210 [Ignavibacteriales bacterium]
MKTINHLGIILVLFFTCLNSNSFGQVDLYLDNLNVYVSEYGRVSFYSLPDTTRQVYRLSLLVGTGQDAVFDLTYDLDVEEPTSLLTDTSFADYQIYGSYNNFYSSAPPNVLEKENIYCWKNLNAVLIKYTVINHEIDPINAIIGWEFLPRIDNNRSGGDTVKYLAIDKTIIAKNKKAVGFKVLSEDLKSMGAFYYRTGYESDSLFYSWLNYNSFDSFFVTDSNYALVDAPAIIPALNSKTIPRNNSVSFYAVLAFGINESDMLASLGQVEQKYNQIVSVESNANDIPRAYVLSQNYPNPFNPSTTIKYQLPEASFVQLKVFNSLGQEVATLVNEFKPAGVYADQFSTANYELPSGIYFYQLKAGNFISTNKMILMK